MSIFRRQPPLLPPPPSLDDQFETLLDQVWDSERRERINDRIDLAAKAEEERERARRRKAK